MNITTSKPTKILIVDDQAVFRKGFCSMLHSAGSPFIVEEASEGQRAIQMIRRSRPDLVLLDAAMPDLDGMQVVHRVHEFDPSVKILIVTDVEDDFLLAFRAGASGCILKNVENQELLNAVGLVLSGYLVFGKAITKIIIENDHLAEKTARYSKMVMQLTSRELEVLSLISQELTNAEIAERLFISPRTVDAHRSKLLRKLGSRNTAGLMCIAMELGLVFDQEDGSVHQTALQASAGNGRHENVAYLKQNISVG